MTRSQLARPLVVALALGGCAARTSPASAPPAPPAATPAPVHATFTGCLLASNEDEASRHPPPPATRAPGSGARITVAPGGVVVEHRLTHACCLTATVTSRLEGRTAVVTERLDGKPCRCMCGSTIRTEVSLPPGAWSVIVEVVDDAGARPILRQDVKVPLP